ncbi:MAG: hypothetical protein A3F16_08595 [Deltaproteobacteria bacterium RIFCSPHIGHO2_12_FULL_43_9]|nr:MAG: hypothetical protein A3F16_08595 [Deltaproteobacteria bacterium RIFCSPHIGHO2_12_FULL_43_9]
MRWIPAFAGITIIFFLIPSKNAFAERIDYAAEIQNKILNSTCVGCHGKFGVSIRNVNLTSYENIVEHGRLVIPGEPEESLILKKTSSGHGGLSKSEIADLYSWIIEGANEN